MKFVLLCLSLLCVGCVSDADWNLRAEYPAATVRLIQYAGCCEDLRITLAKGVGLSSAVDLSVFEQLEPGTIRRTANPVDPLRHYRARTGAGVSHDDQQ